MTQATNGEAELRATKHKSRNDFYFIRIVGEGAYSKVYKCVDKVTDQVFAIKQVSKRLLLKQRKEVYAFREKQVLNMLSNRPYFVHLYFTFQDEHSLYYGMSFHSNGDLLDLITKNKHLKMPCLSFYAAELVAAIIYMHSLKIIHRDLKPENVLLDNDGHIKIIDFGSCRILDETSEEINAKHNMDADPNNVDDKRRHSMVGTAQFVAPEVLQCQEIGYACDYWSLGCMIFQMHSGHHLFQGSHEYDILQKVCQGTIEFSDNTDWRIKDIVINLVNVDTDKRYGVKNKEQLTNHILFKSINWADLYLQTPPDPQTPEE
ncbi:hypothetical protein GJ496_001275 [Pomphorhynchus laevis]|nr:hypothetical protein GJ496_001275 [Pomphorhynchus laevis]